MSKSKSMSNYLESGNINKMKQKAIILCFVKGVFFGLPDIQDALTDNTFARGKPWSEFYFFLGHVVFIQICPWVLS